MHVVNGHHTGQVGIVQAVIRKQNRIIVEGVNLVRRCNTIGAIRMRRPCRRAVYVCRISCRKPEILTLPPHQISQAVYPVQCRLAGKKLKFRPRPGFLREDRDYYRILYRT